MSHFWNITTSINVAKLEYHMQIREFCHKEVSINFRKLSNSQSIDSSNKSKTKTPPLYLRNGVLNLVHDNLI